MQHDPLTGQYYLRVRYYSPATARFTQEDNHLRDGRNLYAYCKNNPVRYTNPSGRQCDGDGKSKKNVEQGQGETLQGETAGGRHKGRADNGSGTEGNGQAPKNKPDATKHSEHRGSVTKRPTGSIVNDIQKARPKDILIEENGNIIIRGANGRVHVLSPDAQRHITTLKRTSSNIERIRQGRYRQATYLEIDKLLELYKN